MKANFWRKKKLGKSFLLQQIIQLVNSIYSSKRPEKKKYIPFPVFGSSVHISLTPSNTMLQWRSKAFTLPNSFLLFLRHFMKKKLFFAQPAVDQDLGVVLDGVREDPEGPGGELLLLLRLALLWGHVCFAGHPDQWPYLSETWYMWLSLGLVMSTISNWTEKLRRHQH